MSTVGALYPVIVDDREQDPPPAQRVAELEKLGVPAKVGRLDAGDYHWMVDFGADGGLWFVVVERKSIADYLSSVRDGRLNLFLDHTGGEEPQSGVMRFLLLEGNQFQYSDYGYNPMEPEALDNSLVSIQRLGVVVVRSPNAGATAERLKSLRSYTARLDHTTFLGVAKPTPQQAYLNPQQKERIRAIMCLGVGIGEQRARALDSNFDSVGAVVDAFRARDYKAFKAVKGIGKGLVDAASDFLGPPA